MNQTSGHASNILLLVTDQERRRMHFPATLSLPHRERLMARGVLFNNFHTSSAPCTPARAALYTGQHAPCTGMTDNINFDHVPDLDPQVPTLGDLLRSAGYHTVYKGKWHLSRVHGEDAREALEPYGFSEYNRTGDHHGAPWGGALHDRRIAEDASSWLLTEGPEIARQQPFFLAVNFINPHDIMFYDVFGPNSTALDKRAAMPTVPPPLEPLYGARWEPSMPPSFFQDDLTRKPAAQLEFDRLVRHLFGDLPRERLELWHHLVDYYINCQRDVDGQIGQVLEALEASGLADRTLVVFVADHGELGGAHGLRQKGPFMYKENINVPLIVAGPEVPRGATTDALMSAIDVIPTLLALAGVRDRVALPEALAGIDLSESLVRPGPGARLEQAGGVLFTYDALTTVDAEYAKHRIPGLTGGGGEDEPSQDWTKRGFVRGIFDGHYKFARYFAPIDYNRPGSLEALLEHNDLELYDTWTDPDELHNLAGDVVAHRGLIEGLNARLGTLIDRELGTDDHFGGGRHR